WVFTTDPSEQSTTPKVKDSFRIGDSIRWWAHISNLGASSTTSTYAWRALGPSSTTLFSWTGTLDDPPGDHYWYFAGPATSVMTSTPKGYYTWRLRAIHDGITSCRTNVF